MGPDWTSARPIEIEIGEVEDGPGVVFVWERGTPQARGVFLQAGLAVELFADENVPTAVAWRRRGRGEREAVHTWSADSDEDPPLRAMLLVYLLVPELED